VLDERLSAARIPGTLTGVLQARLDALTASERRAVQLASVVGPVFWDDALHALDPAAPSMLGALEHKAMVQSRPESAFAGTREAAFQHHLLHQVTYDTVLKADRRDAHARTAAWLAARVGDREAEYLAVTAEHYERAGDRVRALDWYERAATAAEARFANEAAWTSLQRMLAMPELGDSPRRWKAARSQATVADLIADRTRHRAAVDEAVRIAESLGNDAFRASAAMFQALLADRVGDRASAGSHAERAVALAERSGAAAPGALAHAELCWLARERGDIALAHHHIALALPLATEAARQMKWPNDDNYEVMLLLVASALHGSEHDHDRQGQLAEEARALAAQRGKLRLLCSSHEALALWALDVLDAERAERHLRDMEAIAREIGQAVIISTVPLLRARGAMLVGDEPRALALAEAAEAGKRRVDAHAMLGECLSLRATLTAKAGDPAAARELLGEAIRLYESLDIPVEARACRLLLADVWRGEGRLDQALPLVEAELPFLAELGALGPVQAPLPARMAAWHVLEAAGDARASHQLELAMAELQARVARIADPIVRRRILEGSPLHREIVAKWHEHLGPAPKAIADRP
jgi:tetratricopeptide (TPR) repeat protein